MEGGTKAWSTIEMAGEGAKRRARKRRSSEQSEGAPTRTLKQYSVEEKLEIIEFAKESGNRAAGREYNVAESSIREWRKNEEKLRALKETDPDRNRLNGGGRRNIPLLASKALEDIQKNLQVIEVPLSLTMSSQSIDPSAPDTPVETENEASLDAASNISTHSSSPTLSLTGSLGGTNGSGRRKAKQPRKVICE